MRVHFVETKDASVEAGRDETLTSAQRKGRIVERDFITDHRRKRNLPVAIEHQKALHYKKNNTQVDKPSGLLLSPLTVD